jgi:hypothetical protein
VVLDAGSIPKLRDVIKADSNIHRRGNATPGVYEQSEMVDALRKSDYAPIRAAYAQFERAGRP